MPATRVYDNGVLTVGPGDACLLNFDLAGIAQNFVGTHTVSGSTSSINVRSAGGAGIVTIRESGQADGATLSFTDRDQIVWSFRKR